MADTAREQIREAISYNLQQIVKGNTNGQGYTYNNTIYEESIGDPVKTIEEFSEFPAVNIIMGEERANNVTTPLVTGNKTILDLQFEVLFDCFVISQDNIQDEKDKLLADIQARFGAYYWIPNSSGTKMVHYVIYTGANNWGIEVNKPYGGVGATFNVSYRTLISDPTQIR